MLDKDLYDSWKSRMELYVQNREHGRMIFETVEHGPLIWPTIEENGVTRTKKYVELSPAENIQVDCDMKAINIILQGLPTDIYSLVNHHRVTKDLWEKVQLLMQVPVFKQGDDPIDAINKTMLFLSTVVTSRFLITNNQLRNSFNPRQQATIHDGRVTVQPLQGRQNSYAAGTSGTRANTSGTRGNYSGPQRAVKCFNFQGEGHMARQCTKPKRKRDAIWFWKKVLLVEAQGNGKVLTEEELEFLADPAKAVLMEKFSSYGSDVLSEVPISDNTNNDMLNKSVQEMPYSEPSQFVEHSENEIHSDSNIIPYSQYLIESQNAAVQDTNSSAQQDEKEVKNIDNEIALEKKVKELDNIVCKMGQSAQTVHMLTKPQIRPMLYDGNVIAKETNVILIADSEETLMLEEESRSKMFLKQSDPMVLEKKVNTKPIDYAELNRLSEDFGKRFVPQRELSDKQALHQIIDQSASSPVDKTSNACRINIKYFPLE
ncbi:retrovirus-related pol polyprotein from transposon TNT 1-94 [Tanacetum coccineum]|uniref:Retrovirus-related pol polyprotein from transposon TNT 1-94 n=1 Tax=Tanacetum coccineum TaxID=301880 RepID=A0ABQ4Z1D7_9ASTR